MSSFFSNQFLHLLLERWAESVLSVLNLQSEIKV